MGSPSTPKITMNEFTGITGSYQKTQKETKHKKGKASACFTRYNKMWIMTHLSKIQNQFLLRKLDFAVMYAFQCENGPAAFGWLATIFRKIQTIATSIEK